MDILVVGFSCQSISHEFEHASEFSDCIEAETGTTGVTFKHGVVSIQERCNPFEIHLENVDTMTRNHKVKKADGQVDIQPAQCDKVKQILAEKIS